MAAGKVYKNWWIYKITNLLNNKVYIGQTVDVWKRKSAHKLSKNDPERITYVGRSIVRYGWDKHKFEIVKHFKNIHSDLADQIEIYYIKKFNSYHRDNPLGLNLTRGGIGGQKPEDFRQRIKKPQFETHKQKIGKTGKYLQVFDTNGNWLLNHTGSYAELEDKLGISKSRTGFKISTHLKNWGQVYRKKYIIQWNDEDRVSYVKAKREKYKTQRKIAAIKWPAPVRAIEATSTPVLDLMTGVYYNSIADLAKNLGIPRKTIDNRIRNGAYKYRYAC